MEYFTACNSPTTEYGYSQQVYVSGHIDVVVIEYNLVIITARYKLKHKDKQSYTKVKDKYKDKRIIQKDKNKKSSTLIYSEGIKLKPKDTR